MKLAIRAVTRSKPGAHELRMYSPSLKHIPARELAAKFCRDEFVPDIEPQSWIAALKHVDDNIEHWKFDSGTMHLLWTVNGGILRNKIRDDALVLRVLKVALPDYNGLGLGLYRGECQELYQQGKIGFCWSPSIRTARRFASALNFPGVVLKAYAPAHAILAAPNAHSEKQIKEDEYTCDPTALQEVQVLYAYDENTPQSELNALD